MSIVQDIVDLAAPVVHRVWPGVLGSVGLGFALQSWLGYPGFLVGATVGAWLGTVIGDRLFMRRGRTVPEPLALGTLLHAGAALAVVIIGHLFLQIVFIIAVVGAAILIGIAWLAN